MASAKPATVRACSGFEIPNPTAIGKSVCLRINAVIELIVKRASGFIYYVSREGVTGMQEKIATNINAMTALIRSHTKLPIAVGFGISNPEQARTVAGFAEAIVVGSAVVNQIAKHGKEPDLVKRVAEFVRPMVAAVKEAK